MKQSFQNNIMQLFNTFNNLKLSK